MFIETVAVIFVLAFLLKVQICKRNDKNIKYLQTIPGPRPVPIFGNTLDFLTSSTRFLLKLNEYFETYGDIIVVHARLSEILIFSISPKLTENILSSTKFLTKSYFYSFLVNWLGTGLLTSTGTKWRTHRKMLTPSFHFSILTHFVEVFNSVSDNFIEKLKDEVEKPSVDIFPLVSRCTLDIICETAMGIRVNALNKKESPYVRAVKTMCSIISDRLFSPIHWRFYSFTPNSFKEKKTVKFLHSFTEKVIDERIKSRAAERLNASSQEEPEEKKKLVFLDLLLDISVDGKPLTRTEIREEVDTFMFEGHDTTGAAVSFALYSLATNPKIQEKVLEEQRIIFREDVNRKLSISDLQQMKYLDLVIKETLRLYPSVPIIGRAIPKDYEWEDSLLPAGETASIFVYGLHRNPKYFPEPEKFIPERFKSYQEVRPFTYLPFSAGPRNCIGQKFAILEMKTILSKVVRNFELQPSRPAHVLQLAPETILTSKNGVCISLKKRT